MKVTFEGSVEDFQRIFRIGGVPIESMEVELLPEPFIPSGEAAPATFDVVQGDNDSDSDSDFVNRGPELPKLSEEDRTAAWKHFVEVCQLWTQNFGVTEEVEVEVKVPLVNEDGKLVDPEGKIVQKGQKPHYRLQKMFKTQPAPQPDREGALRGLGQGRSAIPVLVMAYEVGSLQRLVEKALLEAEPGRLAEKNKNPAAWLDFVEQISNTMIQVSHVAYPDLAGTLDYSRKWTRS